MPLNHQDVLGATFCGSQKLEMTNTLNFIEKQADFRDQYTTHTNMAKFMKMAVSMNALWKLFD